MDIFSRWFGSAKQQNQEVTAFASGTMCRLSEAPDKAFSGLQIGDGMAIRPEHSTIVAPMDGTVTLIFPTRHVFGMTTPEGIELLIHIGVDTMNLKGKGYQYFKKVNSSVRKSEKIMEVDLGLIKKNGYDPISMMIVVNPNGYTFSYESSMRVDRGKTTIARYMKEQINTGGK